LHFSGEVSVPHLRLHAAPPLPKNFLWAILCSSSFLRFKVGAYLIGCLYCAYDL
jgi:hypothetical protein